jgi:lipoprotein-releasing system ATP-binding protein
VQQRGTIVMSIDALRRVYAQGKRELEVLKGATADLYAGEAVALVGPSGSGKSSLLHAVGLLDRPSGGRIVLDGRDCGGLTDDQRTRLRRSAIGFVYQFHQLMPEFSALENVVLPQLIRGRSKAVARARAEGLLATLGLADRMHHRPAELSGGEQQRTAIARGLANNPRLLLADEPTGNLDPETAERVFAELVRIVRAEGASALIATHNMELANRMDRILRLTDGHLVEVVPTKA